MPPSSALCAIAHIVCAIVFEARVSPRLEQRLDAISTAEGSRVVQRRPVDLPRRGARPHTLSAAAAGGRVACV
eukprot:scaffold75167_cov56-Phaeocystis_antarctica.AAC.1